MASYPYIFYSPISYSYPRAKCQNLVMGNGTGGSFLKFSKKEKQLIIYTIPVSHSGALDKLSWLPAHDENFSVKSTYYLEKTNISLSLGETSKKEGNQKFWNAIWHLITPNCVKHFIWRAINDILATQSKLTNMKILECLYALLVIGMMNLAYTSFAYVQLLGMCGVPRLTLYKNGLLI